MFLLRKFLKIIRRLLMYMLYWPHYIAFHSCSNYDVIKEDVKVNAHNNRIVGSTCVSFFHLMRYNRYFRTLFFFRIGRWSSLLWGGVEKTFIISTELGPGCYVAHPYATTIYARSIGKNFTCHQCTTLGIKGDGDNDSRPTIGDNVTLGTNVCVIGGITIGDNVVVGAGSVVVKDVPNNSIVAGNPAKIIGKIKNNEYSYS